MAGGLLWLSDVSPVTGYVHIAVALVVMGTGMALVMSPASESIMSVLPQAQAGTGSAVNDTVREVGGALGVAVVGSLVSASYHDGLAMTGLAPTVARAARSSIAAADQVAAISGPGGARLAVAAHQAFTTAMSSGPEVAAAVAVLGAIAAAAAV
jgi:hypothetical protein